MRSPHQKHSNKEIHLIGSGQIRKSISKKTVKKRANEKPHQNRPSSHFRRYSAAAQSRTDLRWRTQTLAIRTGYFDQRLMVRRIVSTDRPSDNPDNFVHRSRRHNLGVYHTYQTWTREHNHRLQKGFKLLLLNTIMCSVQTSSIPRHTFHLRSRAGSQGTAEWWKMIWSAEKAREEIQLYIK